MSTMQEAVRSLIGTSVGLGVIRVCQRLYENVPICLVSRDEMSRESEDRLVVALGLSANCRGYSVVVRCLTPSNVHNVAENSLVNRTMSSVRRCLRIAFCGIQ